MGHGYPSYLCRPVNVIWLVADKKRNKESNNRVLLYQTVDHKIEADIRLVLDVT